MPRKKNLLSRFFCRTVRFHDFVVSNLSLKPPPSLSELFETVIIASNHNVSMLPTKFSLDSVFDIEDILHRCIESLLKSGQRNVLTRGYSVIREGYNRTRISGSHCIQMKAPNSIVTYLKTRSWSKLHKFIGDDVLMNLFMNASMFLLLGSNCYVQLCGIPLMDLDVGEACLGKCRHVAQNKENTLKNLKGVKRKRDHSDGEQHDSNKKRRRFNQIPKFSEKQKVSNQKRCLLRKHKVKRKPLINVDRTVHDARKDEKNVRTSRIVDYLKRPRMFYSMSPREGFLPKFILNTAPASNQGVYTVLNAIFHFHKVASKNKRIPKHLIGLKELMKITIVNFKRLKWRKVLNFYCPVPKWSRAFPKKWIRKGLQRTNFQNKVSYKFAVQAFTSLKKVFLFTRYVTTRVFPPEIWGCESNKKTVIKALLRFLRLDRYERLSVGNVLTGIKISQFHWLNGETQSLRRKPLQQSQKQASTIQTFIVWVFNHFLVPLIRGCFYVTESSCHRNRIFYYRKPIWRIICGLGLQPLLGSLYKQINRKSVVKKLDDQKSDGIHQIRLLPGQRKLRPISNMTNCSKSIDMRDKFSMNEELKSLHLALQYETHRNREILGVSVSSTDQIYDKWRTFVEKCKQTAPIHPHLFFISLDISRCFDTLPQDQIIELIPKCLLEDSYQFRKFVKIKFQNGCLRKKYVSLATEETDCTSFITFIRNALQSGRIVAKDTVFVDKVYYNHQSRDNLLGLLRKHVTCSIGWIGDRFVLQKTGIAQGSILATMLNNIHYGNIERKDLIPLFQSPATSIFMRWVDDYLFVTTSRMLAVKFLEAFHTKMPKYGCVINAKKTLLNFAVPECRNKFECIKDDWFPWCGYMFNCKSLECSVNYVQYIGERIQDGVTFEYSFHPGLSMSRKLVLAVCVKATPLITDSLINSPLTIHKNIYQIFCFAALKFLSHAKALRTGGQHLTAHSLFYTKLLKKLAFKFWKVLQNKLRKQSSLVKHYTHVNSGRVEVTLHLVRALCYQAFLDTLRPRRTMYGELVRFLAYQQKYLQETSSAVDFSKIRRHCRYFKMVVA